MSARVVLVAHHANPSWGSEPLIGWRWFEALARVTQVTLVTHARNKSAIEAAQGKGRAGWSEVRYVDTERVAARVARWNDRLWGAAAPVNRLILESISQRAFDRGACKVVARLLAEKEHDVIHRVSPISPRFPTRLTRLGLPVVLGPVNGGMRTMPGFHSVAAAECERALLLRPLARLLDPLQRTWRAASRVLVANQTTLQSLPSVARSKAAVLCENAVEIDAFSPRPERQGDGLRVLYLGRLLRYKGVEHVIRAIAGSSTARAMVLDVVGQGPDRERLEALSAELGVSHRVQFHGACAVDEVPRWMERSDVYAFPSVRESGGSTVLEAMAAATPPIVVDHGGPSETVPEGAGIRLLPKGPEELTLALQAALEDLHDDEPRRHRMALRCREHALTHYTWTSKAQHALDLYGELLAVPGRSVLKPSHVERCRFGTEGVASRA